MSQQQLNEIEEQLELAEESTNQYLDDNMTLLINTHVIPEMKAIATAMNVPKSFVAGIKFVKTGQNSGKIINTWGTREVPLAKFFNYGTKEHDIWSHGPWPLHPKNKKTGEEWYISTKNKPVHVRGVPKTLAMEIGLEQGMKRLKSAVKRREDLEQ